MILILVIGELINASRKSVGRAILDKDTRFLQDLAQKQALHGAGYLDVNVATGRGSQQEAEDMAWAVTAIQKAVDVPLAIDTADPDVLKAGLKAHHSRSRPLINSLSAEPDRLEPFLELATEFSCPVVVLPVREKIPATARERLAVCEELLKKLAAAGLAGENVYVDPLVLPLSVSSKNPRVALETLSEVKQLGAKTIIGLSNVSFGLPERALLNRTFLVMALQAGLDAAILNPLEENLLSTIKAAQALLGYDEYCTGYLRAYRQGKLG